MRALSVNEDSQNNNEDFHTTESSRETLHFDENENQKHPTGNTNRNRPLNQKQCQRKLPAVILGDPIVKELKEWELSDENNIIVTKHFSGATTDDMNSYIQPTISNDPEFIVLHCGTNETLV